MPVPPCSHPPFPPWFLFLSMTEPDHPSFMPILSTFLRQKEEHRRLERLDRLHALQAADALEKVVNASRHFVSPEYRKHTLRLLRSLCGSWGVLPTSYTFHREVKLLCNNPWAHASRYVEVFKGTAGGEVVAVKSLVVLTSEDPKQASKRLAREAVIWKYLCHPNVLPFYGVTRLAEPRLNERWCLISPWMENGTICDFVKGKPQFVRFKLLWDVCSGLQYLHNQDIVHGDLKGANVLVKNNCTAVLADFGFANFDRSRWLDNTSRSTSPGGTLAYMAPELFGPKSGDGQQWRPRMRKETDIYALGMLIYEVSSGRKPFHKVPRQRISHDVRCGKRPERPPSMPDPVWELLEVCWSEDPTQRPSLEHISTICWHRMWAVALPPPSSPSPTQHPSRSSGDGSLPPLQNTQSSIGIPQPSLPITLRTTTTQSQGGPNSLEWVETVTNKKLGQVVG